MERKKSTRRQGAVTEDPENEPTSMNCNIIKDVQRLNDKRILVGNKAMFKNKEIIELKIIKNSMHEFITRLNKTEELVNSKTGQKKTKTKA